MNVPSLTESEWAAVNISLRIVRRNPHLTQMVLGAELTLEGELLLASATEKIESYLMSLDAPNV